MKHTKEPWKTHSLWLPLISKYEIWLEANGKKLCSFNTGNEELDNENAYRVAECVNACKGINPKAIPDMLKALDEAYGEMIQMLSANEPDSPSDKALQAALIRVKKAMAKANSKF